MDGNFTAETRCFPIASKAVCQTHCISANQRGSQCELLITKAKINPSPRRLEVIIYDTDVIVLIIIITNGISHAIECNS